MTPRQIIMAELEEIAARHDVTVMDMLGRLRFKAINRARQEAFYHLWEKHGYTSPRIGRLFGRNHTTVLSGIAAHMIRNGLGPHPMVDHYRRQQARMRRRSDAGTVPGFWRAAA